jgi:hypothetical protein
MLEFEFSKLNKECLKSEFSLTGDIKQEPESTEFGILDQYVKKREIKSLSITKGTVYVLIIIKLFIVGRR